ncbi:uncharacterized protein LOC129739497 isoform X2 [Uranotaenia lowii]|uniref:uncharacterized protein LOC129739497 isoform X2 n=1 Tax=Uranotaenia lowii TaxID=190385 RepID=UPI002478BD09|nr:uncharacterized protein LOC129739497 isoform X2 [Uranotaenia lowii]
MQIPDTGPTSYCRLCFSQQNVTWLIDSDQHRAERMKNFEIESFDIKEEILSEPEKPNSSDARPDVEPAKETTSNPIVLFEVPVPTVNGEPNQTQQAKVNIIISESTSPSVPSQPEIPKAKTKSSRKKSNQNKRQLHKDKSSDDEGPKTSPVPPTDIKVPKFRVVAKKRLQSEIRSAKQRGNLRFRTCRHCQQILNTIGARIGHERTCESAKGKPTSPPSNFKPISPKDIRRQLSLYSINDYATKPQPNSVVLNAKRVATMHQAGPIGGDVQTTSPEEPNDKE